LVQERAYPLTGTLYLMLQEGLAASQGVLRSGGVQLLSQKPDMRGIGEMHLRGPHALALHSPVLPGQNRLARVTRA
jgi:hypothetical protein